jgi:hypothetical protein
MIKVLSFQRSCKSYFRIYKDRSPNVEICCDTCNRKMHKHGRYYRSVTTKQETIEIPVYRWLCPSCRTTVSLLPDFLVPWARIATYLREAAVIRKMRGFSYGIIAQEITALRTRVSRCTVKRWWKLHLCKASKLSLWLAKQLVLSGCTEDLLLHYPNVVNADPTETVRWLQKLIPLYSRKPTTVRGTWSFLHTLLPVKHLL